MEAKSCLKATKRENLGKGPSRQLRRQGLIPAVVYGGGSNMHLAINLHQLSKLLKELGSEHAVLPLSVEGEGGDAKNVIIKDMQVDPISDDVLHVDLLEIFMDREITVEIPVALRGEPEPVKLGDAIIEQLLSAVEIECLPGLIPRELAVDIGQLGINDVIHLRDVQAPEGVKILREPETPVAMVRVVKEEVVEEEVEEEVAEEAEAPAEEAEEQPKSE